MPDFEAMLREYSGLPASAPAVAPQPAAEPVLLDQKRSSVVAAGDAKRTRMGPGSQLTEAQNYGIAAGRTGNTGTRIEGELENDVRNLDASQLLAKYGPAQAEKLISDRSIGAANFYRDRTAERTDTQAVVDVLAGGVGGLAGMATGIASLGAGLVNDKAGAAVAGVGNDISEGLKSLQSYGIKGRRRATTALDQMDQIDNDAQYRDDVAAGNGSAADITRFGRGIKNAVARQLDDGVMLSDGVANAAGSLAGAGMLMKGLAKIGSAALGKATAVGAVSDGAAAGLTKLGNFMNAPVAVGSMEAGGTYQGAMTESMAMLANRTDLTEDQKLEMAGNAAKTAAGIQGMVGAVTGKLVGGFERNLLAGVSLKNVGRNALKETLEEGTQSGTGALSTNYALSREIDPERDLGAGVGEQAGVGGLYGFGSAVAVQGPAAVVAAPFQGAAWAGKKVWNGLKAQGEEILANVKSMSPLSPENIDAARSAVLGTVNALKETLTSVIGASTTMAPDIKTKATDYVSRLTGMMNFDAATLENQNPDFQAAMGGSTNAVDAIANASKVASDEATAPEVRISAGQYLLNMFSQIQSLKMEEISDTVLKAAHDSGAVASFQGIESVLRDFAQDPRVLGAMEAAMALVKPVAPQAVADIEAHDFQNNVDVSVAIAQQAVLNNNSEALAKVNPDVADVILQHHERGDIQLTPIQRSALIVSTALARGEQQSIAENKTAGLNRVGLVSSQVKGDATGKTSGFMSVTDHMTGIMNAVWGNNPVQVTDRFSDLMAFAQSMSNKVDALNDSRKNGGKPAEYQAWNQTKKVWYTAKPVTYQEVTTSSRNFAYAALVDARAVVTMANTMAEKFSELGVKTIAMPEFTSSPAAVVAAPKTATPKPKPSTPVETSTAPTEAAAEGKSGAKIDQAESGKTDAKTKSETPVRADKPVEPATVAPVVEAEAQKEAAEVAVESVVEKPVIDNPVVDVSTVEGLYPSLVGAATNLLKSAFRIASKSNSRIAGQTDIAGQVRKALASEEAFEEYTGNQRAAVKVNGPIVEAYQKLLGRNYMGKVQAAMDAALGAALGVSFAGATLEEYLNAGNPGHLQIKNRGLAIVTKTDTGFEYNRSLQQAAILAGLQWMIVANDRNVPLDDEGLANILNIDENEITADLLAEFSQGVYLGDGIRDLAGMITTFWGLQENNSAPTGHTKGVPGGVAAEVIHALEKAGLLEIIEIEFDGKTYNQAKLFPDASMADMVTALTSFPNAIESAVLTDSQDIHLIGSPAKKIPTTQLRNKLAKLTKQQRAVIKSVQKIPFNLNMPMVTMMGALGKDAIIELFGHGDLSKRKLNKKHMSSLKSVNDSLANALLSVGGLISQVQAQAEIDGTAADRVNIFYDYAFTRVNRLQMLGAYNPQSNKLVREMVLPTRSTLDLSNENSDASGLFWLGVAQAWGVKVHKQARATSVAKAQAMAATEYAGTLEMVREWLGDGNLENASELTAEQIAIIKKELSPKGEPIAPAAFHAVMELARLQNAAPADRAAFETSLYVEADGVTDGPINALVHLARGAFTSDWIKNVAKGGLFFGTNAMTVNAWPDKADLYEVTKDRLSNMLAGFKETVRQSGDTSQLSSINSMERLMLRLLPGMSLDDEGNIKLDRGITKNPLTVTIYGAGKSGVSNKIAGTMTDQLYKIMSAIADGQGDSIFKDTADYKQFIADFKSLTGQDVSADFENVRISRESFANLSATLDALFVTPMQEAIESTIGETLSARTALRKAIQVQSIIMQAAFQTEMAKALAVKKETAAQTGWRSGDFLSQDDLDGIYEKLMEMNPVISTGTQNIYMGGSERVTSKKSRFSRSLSDKLELPAFVYGPEDAGVSGIPGTIISVGDGQMVQNIITGKNAPKAAVYVFDGVNLGLSTLEADSEGINGAVHSGWMENPIQAVAASFNAFMDAANLESVPADQMKLLVRALSERGGPKISSAADVAAAIKLVRADLNQMNLEIQARKNVLARVAMSVDHMASAEASFASPGVDLDGMSFEEQATVLNRMFAEEYLQLTQGQVPVIETEAKPASTDIAAQVDSIGIKNEATGVRIISNSDLLGIAGELNIPGNQKNILGPLLAALVDRNVSVIHGTREQIEAFASARGETNIRSIDAMTKGFFSSGSNTVYLISPSSETLVHELIHAATYNQVATYFSNPSKLTSEQTGAVKRLDALYTEWANTEEGSAAFQDNVEGNSWASYVSAVNAAAAQENAGNRAGAISEMMAWVLANQGLARAARQTTVKSKLARIVGDALESLKTLLWGARKAPSVGEDFYSNLRFNTEVLLRTNQGINSREAILFQSEAFGTDGRLTELMMGFHDRIMKSAAVLNSQADRLAAPQKQLLAATQAEAVSNSFQAHGFPMTPQQKAAFETMLTAFMTETELDPNALVRIEVMYEHVTNNLKASDFRTNPDVVDPADEFQANEKYNSLMGNFVTEFDEQGRSSLLPAFMALANIDDNFRNILSNMPLPKSDLVTGDAAKTFDGRLTNMASATIDNLTRLLSSEGKQDNVAGAINRLTDQIGRIGEWRQSYVDRAEEIMRPTGRLVDMIDDALTNGMQTGSRKIIDTAKNLKAKTNNKYAKMGLDFVQVTASMVNNDDAGVAAKGVIKAIENIDGWKSFRELVAEIIGRTDANASVYDMIKEVRSSIKALRQQFREKLPKIIAEKFTRKLTDDEWTHLFKGLGQTDLAVLLNGFTMDQVTEMLTKPNAVLANVRAIEARLKKAYGSDWATVERKGRELAEFMNTKKVPENLLRNAWVIANRRGEIRQGLSKLVVTDAMVSDIDQLVSLYALQTLGADTTAALSDLATTQKAGLSFALSYLVGQRADEQSKAASGKARDNHYKGFIPSPPNSSRTLVIATDAPAYTKGGVLISEQHGDNLIQRGFVRVADYETSVNERFADKRGYYYAPLATKSAFHEGVMQTVRNTASGVDPVTGFSIDYMTAGRIENEASVKRIIALRSKGMTGGQPLMPIYDGDTIVAFERSVDPMQELRLERNTNLSTVLGIWRGRQVEESMAVEVNRMLLANLHDAWVAAQNDGDTGAFINVMDADTLKADPVLADAMKLMPTDMRDEARELFGDGLWVRKSMVNNTVGYRAASLGDAWTGTTRWDESTQKATRAVLTKVFGLDAYKHLVRAERMVMNVVSDAKVTIVVKSVIVPMANLVSNIGQLMVRGVPIAHILGNIPKKTAEIDFYVKGRIKKIALEAEVRAAAGDVVVIRKLSAKIQVIDDSFKRLSIMPLLVAGEFAAISDVGIGQEEINLVEGRLMDYVEKLVSKLPPEVKTLGRYAIVGKDTALFQGLQRAMEYGDFLGKAILYDDLTKRQGKSSAEALAAITEEFVNYDYLPGRTRTYADNIGLMWFWTFKLRSAKVAMSMIRNNPFRSLLMGFVPTPDLLGTIGNPISDNFVTIGLDGAADSSLGWGMGFNAHNLNPWVNLAT